MIGQTISHYRITAKLGEGGMGAVYRANDEKLRREVALKFLPADVAADAEARKRLVKEARAASRLNHPNIGTIYEVNDEGETPFIAMELVKGESLKQRLQRGTLPPADLLNIARQIADGLEEAHQAGVLHRDIKPANVMLDEHGRVKILDFGIATLTGRQRGQGETEESFVSRTATQPHATTGGTIPYMAPELLRGETADARSDIFAFGVLLYECLAGRLPFRGDTPIDTLHAILHQPATPLRSLVREAPAEWEQFLERCLDKSPSRRFPSMTDLRAALNRMTAQAAAPRAEKSLAILYFENAGGAKDDEYLRDGITEDIITEISKIKDLWVFTRSAVVSHRDKAVTAPQVGQELNATYVLEGSLRRAGNRLRITARLVETRTARAVWAERYDRELKDVFELQDEIARSIADALRITLSPQEEKAIARKPTENTEAYNFYLRGRSLMRRFTRGDLDLALQMFERAIERDPNFALAYASVANTCGLIYFPFEQDAKWIERGLAACEKALELEPELPEALAARARLYWAQRKHDQAVDYAWRAITLKPDCEGAYWTLGQAYFTSDRFEEAAAVAERAIQASGTDYNVYIPYINAVEKLGQQETAVRYRRRHRDALQLHLEQVPDDVRARILLSALYAYEHNAEGAVRELQIAVAVRPNDPQVLYNAACTYGVMGMKAESLAMIKRAVEAGFTNLDWVTRDPDLACLHGDPEFDHLIARVNPAS